MKLRQLLALCLIAFSAAFALEWRKHPHLAAAREQVEHAKRQLGQADDHKKTEFGGHRL